jgi:cytochrome c-type biogenesis protein
MIEDIFNSLSYALYDNFWIALAASFGWGVISIILSPCHLSSIPLVIGFINSQKSITVKKTFTIALVFSAGILITIAAIGLVTAAMGRLMGDLGSTGNYLVAIVFFVMGLYLLDLIKLPGGGINLKNTPGRGLLFALLAGLLFGIGLGPCTFAFLAPVLGIVLQTAQTNFYSAAALLLAFAVGHCAVITGAGTMTQKVQQYLNWSGESKMPLYIKRACGILVILAGIYILIN